MKPAKSLPCVVLLAGLATAPAAPITWTNLGTTTTSVNDIDLSGTHVHAGSWGTGSIDVTVGSETITFQDAYRTPSEDPYASAPAGADSAASSNGEGTQDFFAAPGGFDASFHAVLDGLAWDGPNPKRLVVANLTAGRTYQVQIFTSDDRSCCGERTQLWSDNVAIGSGNETSTFAHNSSSFVIGSFTADATTQTIYGHGVNQ